VVAANKVDLLPAAANNGDLLPAAADNGDGLESATGGGSLATFEALRDLYPDLVPVAALGGQGLDGLLAAVDQELRAQLVPIALVIPYSAGDVLNQVHTHGLVEDETYAADGTRVTARIPRYLLGVIEPYLVAE
jgi:50S ribosomal subunit-associated GTPase HflX